jgi:hypothetical protein
MAIPLLEVTVRPPQAPRFVFVNTWFAVGIGLHRDPIWQPIDRGNDFYATASASQIEYFGVAFVNSD